VDPSGPPHIPRVHHTFCRRPTSTRLGHNFQTPIPTSPGWYFQILLYSNLYLIPITHVPKYPSTRVPNLSDEYSDSFSCFACLIVQIGVSFWPIKARSHQTIRNFDWLITINNQLIFFGHKFIPNICFSFWG